MLACAFGCSICKSHRENLHDEELRFLLLELFNGQVRPGQTAAVHPVVRAFLDQLLRVALTV